MSRMPGSSPRVRGSLDAELEVLRRIRIIPAGAGLTLCYHLTLEPLWDHPRGCGAHSYCMSSLCLIMGSSPRVRGSLAFDVALINISGIIPAGAGLTRLICRIARAAWDHPRGCGAHDFSSCQTSSSLGSSPRVRGSPDFRRDAVDAVGIIPAGAGLTSRCSGSQSHFWDHPRGCGAHFCAAVQRFCAVGSSPRVRGSL